MQRVRCRPRRRVARRSSARARSAGRTPAASRSARSRRRPSSLGQGHRIADLDGYTAHTAAREVGARGVDEAPERSRSSVPNARAGRDRRRSSRCRCRLRAPGPAAGSRAPAGSDPRPLARACDCPWPSGTFVSAKATSRKAGGTNCSRATLLQTSRTLRSRTYQARTCCSIIWRRANWTSIMTGFRSGFEGSAARAARRLRSSAAAHKLQCHVDYGESGGAGAGSVPLCCERKTTLRCARSRITTTSCCGQGMSAPRRSRDMASPYIEHAARVHRVGCARRRCWRGCCTGAIARCSACASSASACRPSPRRRPRRATVAPGEGSATEIAGSVDRLIERLQVASTAHAEREAVYRKLLESMHEAMVVERDGILLANARFAELCGVDSPAELFGRRLSDLVHPDFADLLAEYVRRHLAGERDAGPARSRTAGRDDLPGARLEFSFSATRYEGSRRVMIAAVEMSHVPSRGHGASAHERMGSARLAGGKRADDRSSMAASSTSTRPANCCSASPSAKSSAGRSATSSNSSTRVTASRSATRCARHSRPARASTSAGAACWSRPTATASVRSSSRSRRCATQPVKWTARSSRCATSATCAA